MFVRAVDRDDVRLRRGAERHGDVDVVELELRLLERVLDVDVGRAVALVLGPAVDDERDDRVVGVGLERPPQDADGAADGEALVLVLERERVGLLPLGLEHLGVDLEGEPVGRRAPVLRRAVAAADDDFGLGGRLVVRRHRERALEVERLERALLRELARELLVDEDRHGLRRGGRRRLGHLGGGRLCFRVLFGAAQRERREVEVVFLGHLVEERSALGLAAELHRLDLHGGHHRLGLHGLLLRLVVRRRRRGDLVHFRRLVAAAADARHGARREEPARLGGLLLARADDLGHVVRLVLGRVHLGFFYHVVQLLLVRVHLEVLPNGAQIDVLAVPARRDDLVEREHEVEHLLRDALLGVAAGDFGHDLGEEAERVEVFDDVGGLVGDEQKEDLLDGLPDVSDRVGLDEGVLLVARAHEFGEGGEEALDTQTVHLDKLPCDEAAPRLGQHRRRQHDHDARLLLLRKGGAPFCCCSRAVVRLRCQFFSGGRGGTTLFFSSAVSST
mmetsp:Transcript_6455/g.27161  ORF Transcript_6455/g.27161 Transcript_6455/m.27161 type:complete len:503 (+) Transcript_6455:441-1949(+)